MTATRATGVKYPAYPAYKDSGVAWLGDVPAHWGIGRLKAVVDSPVLKGPGITCPFVALEHVESGQGALIEGFQPESVDAGNYTLFSSGDVLFGKLRPYLRKYWFAPFDGCCPTELLVMRPRDAQIDHRFLYYWVQSSYFVSLADGTSYGVKMPRTSWEILGASSTPVPPLPEQHAIAAFLDRETARIDALVAKKERLIALLQEKRAALISHAVTRGLDPDAPLKDSGVAWLGQVPAHWEQRKLGRVVTIVSGGTPSMSNREYWIGPIPWVSPKDMKRPVLHDAEDHVSERAVSETGLTLLAPETVLIVVRGMILAHTLPVAIAGVPLVINQDMKALVPRSGLRTEFLALLLDGLSSMILSWVEESSHGTKRLSTDILKAMPLFLPLLPEQQQICDHVAVETSKIHALIAKVREHIIVLREHRTALISAAVTGRIDVRGESRSS